MPAPDLTARITQAGLAAVAAALANGNEQVNITHVALGRGIAAPAAPVGYTPTGAETALRAETIRRPVGSGVLGDAGRIDLNTLFNNATLAQSGLTTELGLFLEDGTLFAVYSAPDMPITWISATETVIVAVSIAFLGIPAGSVTWTAAAPDLTIGTGAALDAAIAARMPDILEFIGDSIGPQVTIAVNAAITAADVAGLVAAAIAAANIPNTISAAIASANIEAQVAASVASVSSQMAPRTLTTVYVSSAGVDTAAGTELAPVLTLQSALAKVPVGGIGRILLLSDINLSAPSSGDNTTLGILITGNKSITITSATATRRVMTFVPGVGVGSFMAATNPLPTIRVAPGSDLTVTNITCRDLSVLQTFSWSNFIAFFGGWPVPSNGSPFPGMPGVSPGASAINLSNVTFETAVPTFSGNFRGNGRVLDFNHGPAGIGTFIPYYPLYFQYSNNLWVPGPGNATSHHIIWSHRIWSEEAVARGWAAAPLQPASQIPGLITNLEML